MSSIENSKKLHVELGDRSYPIVIGRNLIGQKESYSSFITGQQILIVTNTTVEPLYLHQVKLALSDYQVDVVVLPDGESYKTLDTLSLIFDSLLKHRHDRTTTLLALGGGVIGDMTGFAASAYQRGVNFIQVPTTLLSQVDSSVGGKTAVNHPLGKNMIGAFYQPSGVIVDILVLDTLPDRELSAGMAEVIKYGLSYDVQFLEWLSLNSSKILAKDPSSLIYIIEKSCHIKALVVAEDERESGVRAILNLGHTFGHAIETHQGYGNWLHGEAVAVGMIMAVNLSSEMGFLSQQDVDRVTDIIRSYGLPTDAPKGMTKTDFMSLMQVDKKVINGVLRLILLKELGRAYVASEYDEACLDNTFLHVLIS
jgi:3-dehydroquinate synthase